MRCPDGSALLQQMRGQRQDVVAAFAQRRQRQRKHVEAVVEIFAEAAGGDFVAQQAVGRGDARARRACTGVLPPRRSTSRSCSTRSSFGLQRERHLGDFVEQRCVPPCACSNLPACALTRAGEGALLVAEQHGFEHVLGNGRAVDRDEVRSSRADWRDG